MPEGADNTFLEVAPDLAIEVISDSDTVALIRGKLQDYFAIGTPVVWLVYPNTREAEGCTPGGHRQALSEKDTLQNPTMPGFSCLVGDLFA